MDECEDIVCPVGSRPSALPVPLPVQLLAEGPTVPRRARHFGGCEAALRRWIRPFEAKALTAKGLPMKPPTVRSTRSGLGPALCARSTSCATDRIRRPPARGGDGQRLPAQVLQAPGGAGRTGEAGPPPVVPAFHGPERNDIERTFHKTRPRRVQPHPRALTAAVQACFQDLRDELVSLHLSIRNA